MAINLDWNAIRPLNGSRADGFEELCTQLARVESPVDSRFERKGSPDAGVECFVILGDGSEWGWQAKYFDNLGDGQWSQIDSSVQTALEKHPRLVRYYICAPLDRPDARIKGKLSAMQRWHEHVKKWRDWAAKRRMCVEFVWWGSSELLDRLARPQHVGRVVFWFDVRGFDNAWFRARLEEAVKTASPRYTPEIHIDLPIAAEMEAFGRTTQFFDKIKAHARDIRKKLRDFGYSKRKLGEPKLDELILAVVTEVQVILNDLAAITVQPVGTLPFREIAKRVEKVLTAITEFAARLANLAREYEIERAESRKAEGYLAERDNPPRACGQQLKSIESTLRETYHALDHADRVAGRALLLLKGAAGTGKTHLLCDVAKQRIAAGRPTVLLMGQQFISMESPWTQALQNLDLARLSAGEFVGALESAAQAANCRALVLIDAVNEGNGRQIWPIHLAAFLAHIERSPWVGVLLSVRSSYAETVVPENVRARFFTLTHEGFADHEYDASRTFFMHYGLDLPSTPLLTQEFRNPLFLKTLCDGLNKSGERRLPRGFHGITAVFDLYLSATNQHLAAKLDFHPRGKLVRAALEAFAVSLVDSGKRWLTIIKGSEVVNAFLPSREFDRSLYRGLVSEGVLVEEVVWREDSTREEVVFIGYERFADHLVAKIHVDAYLYRTASEGHSPQAFAFIFDEGQYFSAGLFEALCIQVPERTGRELFSLAPALMDYRISGDVFRQSLVWRATAAFSEDTLATLNSLDQSEHDRHDTFDAILTVATLPEHPYNAYFIDEMLRRKSMPDRDAWWSTYLHQAWGKRGAVDRLVDWASSVTSGAPLDNEVVELCSITLAWMFTTSNRFLRDRATKALVNLLTGRLDATARLVAHFADVDDLYVKERIFAVAYGVATQCQDRGKVGHLAERVYMHVFANGTPPAHVLLRDYARGVVERAIYLGAEFDAGVVVARIRPPYDSVWPHIPTVEEIKPLMPDWSAGTHESGDLDWARNRIGGSVMDDDFALYVIGTNSAIETREWLSVGLEQPVWQSVEERLTALISSFSSDARDQWAAIEASRLAYLRSNLRIVLASWPEPTSPTSPTSEESADPMELNVLPEDSLDPVDCDLDGVQDPAIETMKDLLSGVQFEQLTKLLQARKDEPRGQPGFVLSQIQRYILWRVFDLGWTTERFGKFDRHSIGYHSHDAYKPERIGKKYQWIAYHEIQAFIADHFQYREPYFERGERSYDGPWQNGLRDIDPTCLLRASRGNLVWNAHTPSWWCAARYENWGEAGDSSSWLERIDDLPRLCDLLRCANPHDATHWLNLESYFRWTQPVPEDLESTDVEGRAIWYDCTGYLVRAADAVAFLAWSKGVDFWNDWMPKSPEISGMFLGEHYWSPASRYFQDPYGSHDGWQRPGRGCSANVLPMSVEYRRESRGFDCSVDDVISLRLPVCELVVRRQLSCPVGDNYHGRF